MVGAAQFRPDHRQGRRSAGRVKAGMEPQWADTYFQSPTYGYVRSYQGDLAEESRAELTIATALIELYRTIYLNVLIKRFSCP